ncbi:nucleotide-binding domain-containing protein [Flavobacterium pallidum]|uniref:Guanylate cyclase domain-containing protein n=1 Tax=Flavobacterium pallidum TaxID=2172098 RepID=A0A2S1SI88_9FLAO|nr:hypothetical protein [Flavobacterium pallidum]AWI26124.1 hypothetical protein HYN49_09565 [Flavobacterium pallidum]
MSPTFTNSLSTIDTILSKNRNFSTRELHTFSKANENSENLTIPVKYETNKTLIEYDRNFILENFGSNDYAFEKVTIGSHPDFHDLDHTNYLMHHCVSMFVDIKGSTKLVDNYTLPEIRLIKDTLISLVVLVANQFGGHIQRLQGDGVFISFVRRNRQPVNSIVNALNASSILAHFVSTDLADIFKKNEIKPLRVRIGIDYGDDKNVLWSYYGLYGCDELTTTSLHTDMAAKLQAKAFDNSIIIGNNIVQALDLTRNEISNYYNDKNTREEVYYVTSTLTYKFYVFEWKNYLSIHPNFKKLTNGNLKHEKKHIYLECEYTFENTTFKYFPNANGIPKGSKIVFKLFETGHAYTRKNFEELKWTIFNTGSEAALDKNVTQEIDKESKNLTHCSVDAKYLGLHKIQCKICRPHSENQNIEFPVIVY